MLVLVGLVAGTAVLLIAGYGVPVGVGLMAGLMLGGVVGYGFARWAGSQTGRSWGLLNVKRRVGSGGAWGRGLSEPDVGLVDELIRDSARVAAVDQGELRRVIAVGQAAEATDVTVELIAVELRADGGVAVLAARTRPPMGPAGNAMHVSVTDDAGTTYAAAGQQAGGSGTTVSRHEVRFAPAPPPAASLLTIRIDSFVGWFPRGDVVAVTGPWEFQLDVRVDTGS